MKKTFLNRRNALLSPTGFSVGAAALAIVFVLVLLRLVFPGVFIFLVRPAWAFSSYISTALHQVSARFEDAAAAQAERERLASQNSALVLENLRLSAKVDDLTKLLGKEAALPTGILAGVLARPPESPYDTLVVGAGQDSGARVGMRAYALGVPLGVVESVTASSARITLFSAPGQTHDGWVGSARTPLTLKGSGGGTFSGEVPQASSVAEGDVVYLPGPGALPVGLVARLDNDPSSPVETLYIKPTVNLFELTWVELRP